MVVTMDINKIGLISDEVYNIKDILLAKVGNTYKCFINKKDNIIELYIDKRYNKIYRIYEWLIILMDLKTYDMCLIDVYKKKINEYKYTNKLLFKLYKDYISSKIEAGIVDDIQQYGNKYKDELNITNANDKTFIYFNIQDNENVYLIYDNKTKDYIICNLEKIYRIEKEDTIILIKVGKKYKIIYNYSLIDYELSSIPKYIEYNGISYLICMLYKEKVYKVLKFKDNNCIEQVSSNIPIEYTSKKNIVLISNNRGNKDYEYDMVNIENKQVIMKDISIKIGRGINNSSEKYTYRDIIRVLKHRIQNKDIIFINMAKGNIEIGEQSKLKLYGNINSRITIIDKSSNEIYYITTRDVYSSKNNNKQINNLYKLR